MPAFAPNFFSFKELYKKERKKNIMIFRKIFFYPILLSINQRLINEIRLIFFFLLQAQNRIYIKMNITLFKENRNIFNSVNLDEK